jgi:SAM-dependent methyltransferase
MTQFNNAHQSHQHSLQVLNLLKEHDSFMESISTVADIGSGQCLDTLWWANATTRDEPAENLNLKCYAVDRSTKTIDFTPPTNFIYLQRDFETKCLPEQVDVIWCHNAFQYALNPLSTLRLFNQQMNTNGMLYLGIPLLTNHEYGRWQSKGENYQFFNHTFVTMLYMLAVNGFDCRDAYFRKAIDDPWLHVAVFKTDTDPMDPARTSWFDLGERGLLHDSVYNSLRTYGYVRQQDALYPWLDKALYRIDH